MKGFLDMRRIFMALIEILSASVFILPIFFLYHKFLFRNGKRTMMYIVLACYFVAVMALVGLPNIRYRSFDVSLNVVPFIGMASDFKNACLNVLLFVPLGMFLPTCWNRYRQMKHTAVAGLSMTCVIEVLQIFTHRATDIDDIITNTLGTLIGYGIVKAATKDFSRYVGSNRKNYELGIVLGTTAMVCKFNLRKRKGRL